MNGHAENEILNSGLDFAMEFGENWLRPIQERLLKKFDYLNKEQLDKYDLICRTAMNEGHQFIYSYLLESNDKKLRISKEELFEKFKNWILDKYPWTNNSNLTHLFGQSIYYAYKGGLAQSLE